MQTTESQRTDANVMFAGYRAATQGKNRADNPFGQGTDLSVVWWRGYDLAREDLDQGPHDPRTTRQIMSDNNFRPCQASENYEFATRFVVGVHPSTEIDAPYAAGGWTRVWADITTDGTFIVYRRERA